MRKLENGDWEFTDAEQAEFDAADAQRIAYWKNRKNIKSTISAEYDREEKIHSLDGWL